MADFNKSLPLLFKLEFDNNPAAALEQVVGEAFITFCGINERDESDFAGWKFIHEAINQFKGDLKGASKVCYANTTLMSQVSEFYKRKYWDVAKLDQVLYQHTADEIFTTSVLIGITTGIKLAQKVVGVTADGVVGLGTIAALNKAEVTWFDKAFDDAEITHYQNLAAKNHKFQRYLKGWINRAEVV